MAHWVGYNRSDGPSGRLDPTGDSLSLRPVVLERLALLVTRPRCLTGALVAGPGEDGAAGAEGDRGAYREVGAADDANHEGAVVGGAVGLAVEDGVVAVVAVRRDPAG